MKFKFIMLDKYNSSKYIFAGSDIFTNISRTDNQYTTFCTCYDMSHLKPHEIDNLINQFETIYCDNLQLIFDSNDMYIEFISRDVDVIYEITEKLNPKIK